MQFPSFQFEHYGIPVLCPPANGSFSLSSSIPTLWTISPGGLVTTSIPTYGGGITVTNSSTAGSYVTLTANVEGCRTVSTQISLGVPPPLDFYLSPSVDPFCTNSFQNFVTVEPENVPANVSFEWGYVDQTNLIGPVVVNSNGGIIQAFIFSTSSLYQIYARPENSCGYSQGDNATLNIQAGDCGEGGLAVKRDSLSAKASPAVVNDRLSVYPIPVTDVINIRLPDAVSLDQAFVRVIDMLGRPLKLIKLTDHSTKVNMSGLGAGTYIIEINLGKKTIIKKAVKL